MGTYYIDYANGSDSNNGTAKETPWKRHPYMVGFTGSYSHSAGDQFIFKGGVTWPNACFPMVLVAGGSVGNIDTYTVDAAWYTGGAWARPIFDCEDTETASTNNVLLFSSGLSYITINDIEITRFYWVGPTSWPNDHIIHYQDAQNCTFSKMYIHAFTHGTYAAGTRDDAMVFCGYTNSPFNPGVVIDSCTVDGSDGSGDCIYATYEGADEIKGCVIHDVVNGIASVGATAATHLIHDNLIYKIVDSFDPGSHENALVMTRGGSLYNNKVHEVVAAAMCVYVYPGEGDDMSDQYIYNNVVWDRDESANGCITIDVSSTTKYTGTVYVLNNTLVADGTAACLRQQRQNMTGLTIQNNHFITSAADATTIEESIDTLVEDYNLKQTVAQAIAEGYDKVAEYIVVAGGSTIDAGYDTSATVTTDINGVSRPQDGTVDIGAYEYDTGVDPPGFHVYYAANGALSGAVPTDATDYPEDDLVTILGNSGSLARESYYAFVGWNTAADGSGTDYAPGATMTMPAADVTLYAQWRVKCALIAG